MMAEATEPQIQPDGTISTEHIVIEDKRKQAEQNLGDNLDFLNRQENFLKASNIKELFLLFEMQKTKIEELTKEVRASNNLLNETSVQLVETTEKLLEVTIALVEVTAKFKSK